jgi:hypothetical protein
MQELANQAILNLFVGFGLALVNVLIIYFVRDVPRVISVLRWRNKFRAIILAYLIALALQLVTSPIFRSFLQSVYTELAWSPYQAIFNVLGIMLMDLFAFLYQGARRGAEVGQKRFAAAKERAADALDDIQVPRALSPEEHAAQRKAQQEAEAAAAAERKKRLDDQLKDY